MEELKLSVNNHYCDEVRGPLVPSMGRQRSYLFNYVRDIIKYSEFNFKWLFRNIGYSLYNHYLIIVHSC